MKNFFVRYKRVIFSVLLSVLLVGLVLFLCIAPYFLNERKSAHAEVSHTVRGSFTLDNSLSDAPFFDQDVDFSTSSGGLGSCTSIAFRSPGNLYYTKSDGSVSSSVYSGVWLNQANRTIDFGDSNQTISETFYTFLVNYSVAGADGVLDDSSNTLSGSWQIKAQPSLTNVSFTQPLAFSVITSSSNSSSMTSYDGFSVQNNSIIYTSASDSNIVFSNSSFSNWQNSLVYFMSPQAVSEDFYSWFTANAIQTYSYPNVLSFRFLGSGFTGVLSEIAGQDFNFRPGVSYSVRGNSDNSYAFTVLLSEGYQLSDVSSSSESFSLSLINSATGTFNLSVSDYPAVGNLVISVDSGGQPVPDDYTLDGVWTFNADPVLPSSTLNQSVEFYSNDSHYASFMVTSDSIYYVGGADDSHSMIAYKSSTGWAEIGLQSIDFGDTPQEVSEEFYNWLSDNAIYEGDTGSFSVNAGYYLFNTDLTLPNDNYIIQIPFISNGVKFRQIEVSSTSVRFAPQATGSPVTVYSSTDSVFNPQYQIIKIENDYIIPFLDQYNWFSSNTVPFDEDLNEYYDSIYNSGYQQGLQDGDAEGYDKGYTDGYQVGHAHGASESYQEFNVVYTFLAPVRSFLETPLFGSFSFGDAFAVFFAVAIGVIFIKMFSGG